MSQIHKMEVQCDHCGVYAHQDGNGTEGWNIDGELMAEYGADLCPNCLSELKAWFVAGPQHAAMREQMAKQQAITAAKQYERNAFRRHPASNRLKIHTANRTCY